MDEDFNRLTRDNKTRSIYNSLMKDDGPLKGFKSRHIFNLALAIGITESAEIAINDPEKFIKPENFGKILLPLVYSVAICKSEEGIEILASEKSKIFSFAEEYANAGIHLLKSKYNGSEDQIIENWRREIMQLVKSNDIFQKIEKEIG